MWELKKDRPVYIQLEEIIQMKIISGEYPRGQKIMSVRELAAEASVNPNTMQRALMELEGNGLLVTERASGRYVTEDDKMIRAVRESLAKEQIEAFVESMKKLGMDREEIIELIRNHDED